MMDAMMTVTTLRDGTQPALRTAQAVHDFLAAARKSLDLALYDLNLGAETEVLVVNVLEEAAARGVRVRLMYDLDHAAPIPVPPPPESVPEDIERLRVPTRPIAGVPDLMHHKFAVRDGEAVWTGSANWTDDSWSRQENVIAVVGSRDLAHAYTLAFDQLWESSNVIASGRVEPRPIDVDGVQVRPWFCPGFGDALSHRIAKYIGRARRRVRICSPVISAAPVLATLAQVVSDAKVDIAGAVDVTQIEDVLWQWEHNNVAAWKIPLLRRILEAPFSGKRSTQWAPDALHDYMHAKATIADDVVFLGSFNLSHSGERNAEDMLEIHDAALAERLAAFVDEVRAAYPPARDGLRPAAKPF
jgi:phosphatidylserine/phosphatidylglycerophosphate/cardiolipin synthase-like enzyme